MPAPKAPASVPTDLAEKIPPALLSTWGSIADEFDVMAAEIPRRQHVAAAAELCYDADRMVMYGGLSQEDYNRFSECFAKDFNAVVRWCEDIIRPNM